MVWVLTGTLNSQEGTAANVTPPRTSHWLRPGRTYRLGRAPDKEAGIKPRLHDFYLNSAKISKQGHWEVSIPPLDQVPEWTTDDDPTSLNNLEPYPLTLTAQVGKVYVFEVEDSTEQFDKMATSWNIKSGMVVKFGGMQYDAKFEWMPLIFAVSSASAAKKREYAQLAKSMGFKLAYKTFRAHHTHWLTKKFTPSMSLLSAALVGRVVADPSYLDKLAEYANCPRTSAGDLPAPRPAEADLATTGNAVKDAKLYRGAIDSWETKVYGRKSDAGSDVVNWWGKSILEADWTCLPSPTDHPSNADENFPAGTAQGWGRREDRTVMFRDVIALPFQEEPDDDPSPLFELGDGHLVPRNMLPLDRPVPELRDAIEDYKRMNRIAGEPRFVIIPPEGCTFEPAQGEPAKFKSVRELARVLSVTKFIGQPLIDLIRAIYEADPSPLFGPLVMVAPTPTPETGANGGASLGRTNTGEETPFPSSGIPGTSEGEATRSLSTTDGPTQTGGAEASESGVASAATGTGVRKLKRNARGGPRTLDALFGLDRPREPETSGDLEPPTSSSVAAIEPPASMDVDQPASSTSAPTTRRLLKRRVVSGNQEGSASRSLFDDLGSSAITQAMPPTKKARHDALSREERLRQIEEEDNAEASRELERKRTEEEARKVAETPRVGKKRQFEEVMGENDGEEVTPRAKGNRKGKAVAVAPAKKRGRSASVQPPEVVDDESAEEEDRATRASKSKKKETSTAAARKKGKTTGAAVVDDEPDEPKDAPIILQAKTRCRKGKAAELEQALNDDFNRLKIVKPDLKKMRAPERHRMTWDEIDAEAERMRLIREDQEELADHPDTWVGKRHGLFVIRRVPLARKEPPQPRHDLELEEKWRGRPNFKAFRPKNASGASENHRVQRVEVELTVAKRKDFGLGANYKTKAGRGQTTLATQSQSQTRNDDDDDDDSDFDDDGFQPMRKFVGSKAKKGAATTTSTTTKASSSAKVKGQRKGKQVARNEPSDIESDNDDDDAFDLRSSHTLNNDDDDDELDEVDTDASDSPGTSVRSRGSKGRSQSMASTATRKQASASIPNRATASKASASASTSKRQPRAAAAPVKRTQTITLDDSSDSESGLTFKGFNSKKKR